MVDINSSQQWLSMMRRTKAAIPDLIDQANESGDYSKVDQAHQVMDRLLAMGDQHLQAMKGAVNQDKAAGHDYAQNHPLSDPTPGDQGGGASTGGNLPSIDPQAMGQPNHDGTPESTAHEAARGAAKGIIEAQQQAPGTYKVPSIDYFENHTEPAETALPPGLHYGPGELKMEAKPGYAPGELSFKSDFAPWNIPPAPKREQPGPDDFSDVDTALEQAKKIDSGDSELGAGDLMEKARKLREGSALPDFSDIDTALEQAKRIDKSALPKPEDIPVESDEEDGAGSALPDLAAEREEKTQEFARNMGRDPVTGAPVEDDSEQPSEADEGADIDKYTPAMTRKYGSDPKRLVNDFLKSPGLSDYDREFVHRVQMELGKRPQLATIPKILAALTLGVGSALGSWITGRYNGQALLDLSEDQKHYDAQKAQIGRETYLMNKKENVADTRQQNAMDRTRLQEEGKNARQQVGEAGKNSRLETQETGRNSRLQTQETGKDTRQKNAIDARKALEDIRAKTKTIAPQMSIADKAEINRLHLAYSGLDRTLMTVDPKVKAQGDDILRQINDIIDKYRTTK